MVPVLGWGCPPCWDDARPGMGWARAGMAAVLGWGGPVRWDGGWGKKRAKTAPPPLLVALRDPPTPTLTHRCR
eukprot:4023992-Prymnesium_polylepis.1